MTHKEIRDRIIFTLGLQDDTSFNETSYVEDLIYEGIVDILARCRPYTRVINLTLQPNTPIHDMSSTIISIVDLSIPVTGSDGITREIFLKRFSREDITALQGYGLYEGYGFAYEEPLLWVSPVSDQELTAKAYGIFRPGRMTADDQTPATPSFGGLADEFHPTIVTYALWKGGEYMQHDASGNGEKWRIQYEGQVPGGDGGELSKIRRILTKRVTPAGTRRRNPLREVGVVPDLMNWTGG